MVISGEMVTKQVLAHKGARVIVTQEAQARIAATEPTMARPHYVVADLMDRKNWNKPDSIGIKPENMGLAIGIKLTDIKAVIIP